MTRISTSARDALAGWLVLPAGDAAGQLIGGSWDEWRSLCVACVGGLLYRYEITAWFRRLAAPLRGQRLSGPLGSRLVTQTDGQRVLNALGKTLGALLYFNPLWLARHLFVLRLSQYIRGGMPHWDTLVSGLLLDGLRTFLSALPISILGNYLIQVHVPLRYRFLASTTFSGTMACVYALGNYFFSRSTV